MSHDDSIDVPRRQPPLDSHSERLTEDELLAFRDQFRALRDVTEEGLDDVADDCIPARIAHFSIIRRLGSGSFGCVYLAFDGRLSRYVAIKVSHLGIHSSGPTRTRFIREAQAAARLAHPNVVCLHEYGEEQGLLYLVYEMCQGPTLEDWMVAQTEPIPIRLAVGIVRELAQGLAHAHVRGLIHRDVKPNNVLLTANCDEQNWLPYTPRLTDFGLAHDSMAAERQSLSARLVGTIDTMSPEQARGDARAITPAADQYSLGIILYRLLTGTVPFAGDDVVKTLQRICKEHPRSPRSLRPEVSRDLAAIVLTCLNKSPRSRYASCQDLSRDLDRYLRAVPVAARPLTVYQRGWRVLRAAPLVSALALVLILGSLASAVTFSMMATSLTGQQQRLQHTLQELVVSESRAITAKEQTEEALAGVLEQKRVAELQRVQAVRQAYRADMHRVFEAWQKKHVLTTLDMVEAIRENITEVFEPCYGLLLLEQQVHSVVKRLGEYETPVTEVKAVPGTPLVVSVGHSGQLDFYHAVTGNLEHSMVPQAGCEIDGLDINSDGTKIAIGFNSTSIPSPYAKVYPLNLYQSECWLGEPEAVYYTDTTVESLRFSPCGQYLAIGQRYQPVIIRELASGELVTQIVSDSRNRSVDFSPDGLHCLVTPATHDLILATTQSGEVSRQIVCDHTVQCARWSSCGDWLAYARYGESEVTLVSPSNTERTVVLLQPHGSVESLSFSQDGCWLVAGTQRGGVAVWWLDEIDSEKNNAGAPPRLQSAADFVSHAGLVTSVCIVAEKWVASGSDSGTVVLNPLPSRSVNHLGSEVTVAAIIEQQVGGGNPLLQGWRDGRVVLVRFDGEQQIELSGPSGSPVTAVGCSRDGGLAAVGWADGRIAIVDLNTNQWTDCRYTTPLDSLEERTISSLAFDDEGLHLAACGNDARLRVWSVNRLAQPCWETTCRSYAFVTCFCGPGRVAVGGMFEEILVFDCDSGKPLTRILGASRTISLLYDSRRDLLLSGHLDGRLRIHSGEGWQEVKTLNGEAGEIVSLIGSPNGDSYISGDSLGNIAIWSADQRELIGSLHGLPQKQRIAAMSLDPLQHDLLIFHADRDEGSHSGLNCSLLSVR